MACLCCGAKPDADSELIVPDAPETPLDNNEQEWVHSVESIGFLIEYGPTIFHKEKRMIGKAGPGKEGRRCLALASKLGDASDGVGDVQQFFLFVKKGIEGPNPTAVQKLHLKTNTFIQGPKRWEIPRQDGGKDILSYLRVQYPGDSGIDFYSVGEGEAAKSLVTEWVTELKKAKSYNANNFERTVGAVHEGAPYAIVSFPGESQFVWRRLVDSSAKAGDKMLQHQFGSDKVSLCCVWTTAEDDAWWNLWTANVEKANSMGQTLLVYERNNWAKRVEEKDVFVPGDKNKSWPGVEINVKKGQPIQQFGNAQLREIEWIKAQGFTNVQYRSLTKTYGKEAALDFYLMGAH